MSRPSKVTFPAVGSSRRMMQRAIVDLPQPDSPTTPSVSPSRTVKLTPSTAFTAAICFWKMIPWVTGKCFFRSSTTRSSWPATLRHLRERAGNHLGGLAILGRLVEMAGLEVQRVVADRFELGLGRLADLHHVRAARVEAAAPRRIQERGRLARDLYEPLDVGIQARQRAEQAPGVRVVRAAEDRLDRAPLGDPARVH